MAFCKMDFVVNSRRRKLAKRVQEHRLRILSSNSFGKQSFGLGKLGFIKEFALDINVLTL